MQRRNLMGMAGLACLGGCASLPRLPAVPESLAVEASIPGIPGARFYADEEDPELLRWILDQRRRANALRGRRWRQPEQAADVLVLSGGGENGAFGAGVITAWTAQGNRPQFQVVTGISTGALAAPFAFLGPSHDAQLRAVYTGVSANDILLRRSLAEALFGDALTDSAPLANLIAQHFDQGMLDEIGVAYDAGRLLLIGTTDLDARRAVIWNIGAIAKSRAPGALDLVRRVLLASASIPGAMPPVMFDVEAAGRRFQEMHVDGGSVYQLFLFPHRLVRAQRVHGLQIAPTRIWVIRNGRLRPLREETPRRTLSVLTATVGTMTQAAGSYDVTRIWLRAQRAGLGFNLAYIGDDFMAESSGVFDQDYMRALFAYGEAQVRQGTAWVATPPSET